jgi:hypothetical protein
MLSVQLELKELQEKYCLCDLSLLISRRVAKAEMLLQDDGEVSKLEEECNWFRNETNRLQTHSTSMQHDIHVRLSFLFLAPNASPHSISLSRLSVSLSLSLSPYLHLSEQALRTRLTALKDQNQYLSSQLKAVMKRSRVLEVILVMVLAPS